ncbi:hypothetical protein F4561_003493 [Lipingzhangella halophila]|uniref:Uncharacterized protein n=1 Tax=Lipingzhangella halophila TaxID=1783352 RepID=A0A7W7RIL4_9ACTN|nr:hypothetical protein [Lipingzhangella halophila]
MVITRWPRLRAGSALGLLRVEVWPDRRRLLPREAETRSAAGTEPRGGRSADEAALDGLYQRRAHAWAGGAGTAFAEAFTRSYQTCNGSGPTRVLAERRDILVQARSI